MGHQATSIEKKSGEMLMLRGRKEDRCSGGTDAGTVNGTESR